MSSTIKIKALAMPEPWIVDLTAKDLDSRNHYSADQLAARDAQWQEMYSLLLDELRDAATSLETISRSAGKRWVLDEAGNHVENYLQHPDQIRGYAASRAAVARSALSAITEE